MVMFTVCIAMCRGMIASFFSSQGLVTIPMLFIVSLGILYVVRIWTDLFAVILQSMNDMKVLLVWAAMQAAIGLGLQILLVPRFGIYGTVAALCLSWMLTVGWALPNRVWRLRKKAIEARV